MNPDLDVSPTIVDSSIVDWVDHPRFHNITVKSLITPASNALAGVNLVNVPPGGVIGRHLHPKEIETVYVLAGQSELTLGDTNYVFGAGQIVAIPIGLEHALRNTGAETVVLLTVFTPPLT